MESKPYYVWGRVTIKWRYYVPSLRNILRITFSNGSLLQRLKSIWDSTEHPFLPSHIVTWGPQKSDLDVKKPHEEVEK